MGLEIRGQRAYFYEKIRVGRRVLSKYVGSGELAALASSELEQRRRATEQQRARQRKIHNEQKEIDSRIEEQARIAREAAEKFLQGSGFHKHKGQWRRIRRGAD